MSFTFLVPPIRRLHCPPPFPIHPCLSPPPVYTIFLFHLTFLIVVSYICSFLTYLLLLLHLSSSARISSTSSLISSLPLTFSSLARSPLLRLSPLSRIHLLYSTTQVPPSLPSYSWQTNSSPLVTNLPFFQILNRDFISSPCTPIIDLLLLLLLILLVTLWVRALVEVVGGGGWGSMVREGSMMVSLPDGMTSYCGVSCVSDEDCFMWMLALRADWLVDTMAVMASTTWPYPVIRFSSYVRWPPR